MMNYNQFSEIPNLPVTLEENIIKKRLPLVNKNLPCEGTYKPVLDDNIDYGVL